MAESRPISRSVADPSAGADASRRAGGAGGGGSGGLVVAVQGLTKTFKDFWMRTRAKAVDNVTFQVHQGEIFGLLGPNGSGKSTTIKILLGLLRQTSGRVAVFGRLPTDVAIKKRIGYLPEESYLYPFLNARETLDYYAKLFQLDYKVRQRRIDELLDMVGLAGVQHRAVREYSKGMQRRIGIAQALINDPEFLVLDEPTTGLDPIGSRQIKDLILTLGRRGKSILLSSHLLADVEDCVDRMVILYGGKIREEGTCEDLLTSEGKSIIEADALDEATIAEIDEVVRRRTGGRSAITRVSKPRQKLEDKFISIVERAMDERAETSGAQHGGQTAAFLREGGTPEGADLIEALVRSTDAPGAGEDARSNAPAVAGAPPLAARPGEPDASVIAALTGGGAKSGAGVEAVAPSRSTPSSPPQPPPPAPTGRDSGRPGASPRVPGATPDVDQSVIDSLLGGDSPDSGGGTGGRSGGQR